jgi:hypothetical protein
MDLLWQGRQHYGVVGGGAGVKHGEPERLVRSSYHAQSRRSLRGWRRLSSPSWHPGSLRPAEPAPAFGGVATRIHRDAGELLNKRVDKVGGSLTHVYTRAHDVTCQSDRNLLLWIDRQKIATTGCRARVMPTHTALFIRAYSPPKAERGRVLFGCRHWCEQ